MQPETASPGDPGHSSSGSTAPVFTVPRVAATQKGGWPAARSSSTIRASAPASIRPRPSTGTGRTLSRPMPSSPAAFAMEKCPSRET